MLADSSNSLWCSIMICDCRKFCSKTGFFTAPISVHDAFYMNINYSCLLRLFQCFLLNLYKNLSSIANVFMVFFQSSSDLFDILGAFSMWKTYSSNPTLLICRLIQESFASAHGSQQGDLSPSDSIIADLGTVSSFNCGVITKLINRSVRGIKSLYLCERS